MTERSKRAWDRTLRCGALLWSCWLPGGSAAELDAVVADLAARIEYGFYTADAQMIEAARAGLQRLPPSGAREAYYSAFAAYRLAQLAKPRQHRQIRELVSECVESAHGAAADPDWAVEGWVLVGSCSLLGAATDSLRALGHELRYEEAIAEAAAIDASNPRLLLLGARVASSAPDSAKDRDVPTVRDLFERSLTSFDAWAPTRFGPDWGRAEALTGLAAMYLAAGELRQARDLIENALIEAPEYRVALELKKELLLQR